MLVIMSVTLWRFHFINKLHQVFVSSDFFSFRNSSISNRSIRAYGFKVYGWTIEASSLIIVWKCDFILPLVLLFLQIMIASAQSIWGWLVWWRCIPYIGFINCRKVGHTRNLITYVNWINKFHKNDFEYDSRCSSWRIPQHLQPLNAVRVIFHPWIQTETRSAYMCN